MNYGYAGYEKVAISLGDVVKAGTNDFDYMTANVEVVGVVVAIEENTGEVFVLPDRIAYYSTAGMTTEPAQDLGTVRCTSPYPIITKNHP